MLVVALALTASRAFGLDITACGQNVPDGDVGVLQADLDCAGTPGRCELGGEPCTTSAECAPYQCEPAIQVGRRSILELNGHTLRNTAVQCPNSGKRSTRCRIVGPGTIIGDGTQRCISGGVLPAVVNLVVSDLAIRGCRFGLRTDQYNSSLLATNVSADDNIEDGIFTGHLKATNVSAARNGGYGVFANRVRVDGMTVVDNGESGIYAAAGFEPTASLRNLTATGNGEGGVLAYKVKLIDSLVTGNLYDGENVDIAVIELRDNFFKPPRLVRTTCEYSRQVGIDAVFDTMGVCSAD